MEFKGDDPATMKPYFNKLAAYNYWANSAMREWVVAAGETACSVNFPGSFHSVKETLLHMGNAQDIWLNRLNGSSPAKWPDHDAKWPASVIAERLAGSSSALVTWVEQASEEVLQQQIQYRNLKGDPFVNTASEILAHVINHSTFHRGQVVNMLRAAGYDRFTSTDLIGFYRLD